MNPDDIPLTDSFYDNPLEYMQSYVRNLNNEIFLSEYQINNLYALLLISRNSPWDGVKGNAPHLKDDIDTLVTQKIKDVKSILQSLSNVYEDKAKKNALNQIERLMGILKSKKKAIYIQKTQSAQNYKQFQLFSQLLNQEKKSQEQPYNTLIKASNQKNSQGQAQHEKQEEKSLQNEKALQMKNRNSTEQIYNQQIRTNQPQELQNIKSPLFALDPNTNSKNEHQQAHSQLHSNELEEQHSSQISQNSHENTLKKQEEQHEHSQDSSSLFFNGNKEVFTLFYGLASITNLSAMALTNLIDYNSAQRSIKFKMSENYNVTIQSQDPLFYDRVSTVKRVPADMFVNHIFPFLSASDLFKMRGVCKQWLENVKEAWHSTFKREMYIQLLACQFCKDIEFYYKAIQLRNPFFQKLSLLIHALIQIIQWENVSNLANSPNLPLQLKRIFLIMLRLIGEPIPFDGLASMNDALFQAQKHRLTNIKQKLSIFFNSLSGADLSIDQLRQIKVHYLDNPFMRAQQLSADDKTPLLLTLLVKQITLQQILRNHIYFAQQYLLNTKKRLDYISKKMVYQKGYLQGVYKILLLKNASQQFVEDKQQPQIPDFHSMVQSMFGNNSDRQKPDFVIKSAKGSTEIFFDKATKLDLLLATMWSYQQQSQEVSSQNSQSRQSSAIQSQDFPQEQRTENRTQRDQLSERPQNISIHKSVNIKIQCKGDQTQIVEGKEQTNPKMQQK